MLYFYTRMPVAVQTMPTQLPVWIDPCPIIEVVSEIRFETAVPAEAIAGMVFASVRDDFPRMATLPAAAIPAETRRHDPHLAYQAHYRLEGDSGVVLVGPNAVAIGISDRPYPGWPVARRQFEAVFERVAAANFISKVMRFGLRYVNFFEGNVLPQLTLSFNIDAEPITGVGTSFTSIFQERGCQLLLQVHSGVTLVTNPAKSGSVIDIDAFNDKLPQSGSVTESFASFLEIAHSAEKGMFFRLLAPELLQSLNPSYGTI